MALASVVMMEVFVAAQRCRQVEYAPEAVVAKPLVPDIADLRWAAFQAMSGRAKIPSLWGMGGCQLLRGRDDLAIPSHEAAH